MKKISERITLEFEYDTETERAEHVLIMEKDGFVCDGQIRKSLHNDMLNSNKEYVWFARFYKYKQ